jgi:predicted phage gp36 major capsid-like protein
VIVRALRDPLSAKPYMLFHTNKQVGGGVQDLDSTKRLNFAAS